MKKGDILKRKSPTGNGQKCILLETPADMGRIYIGYIGNTGRWETEVHDADYFEETNLNYNIEKIENEIRQLLS